jgi:hypothetical protein
VVADMSPAQKASFLQFAENLVRQSGETAVLEEILAYRRLWTAEQEAEAKRRTSRPTLRIVSG